MRLESYFFLNMLALANIVSPRLFAQNNPFLRPGSNVPKPPVIQRAAPPPPKPIPRNPNIEFRGYYEFQGEWKIALFDKAKNQGFWLSQGERLADFDAEVENFNPETEVLKLRGGMTLSLKDSDKTILPVPSGQPVKPPATAKPASPAAKVAPPIKPSIPLPRRR
jgi:hypothetical protein